MQIVEIGTLVVHVHCTRTFAPVFYWGITGGWAIVPGPCPHLWTSDSEPQKAGHRIGPLHNRPMAIYLYMPTLT